ncbi:MAG TPA: hypothetical protein VH593_31615 [Ktedonobacteraceae bacterium]|jgi:hypothetical protein
MLAHNDTVVASWCAKNAFAHIQQFESILATYHDHSTSVIAPNATAKPNMVPQSAPVNQVLSCGQVEQNPGPNMWGLLPSGDPNFGQQVVPQSRGNTGANLFTCVVL